MVGKQIAYLDGWRGIAIVLLLAGHFFSNWRFHLGSAGVDLFFVLSGLLMTKQLIVHKVRIGLFYQRRISRVLPALAVYLLLTIIIHLTFDIFLNWREAMAATFLIRNYYPVGFGENIVFDHIWSLSVEEHAYILLSIVAVLARQQFVQPKKVLACLSLCCVVTYVYYQGDSSRELLAIKALRTEIAGFGIVLSGLFLLYFTDKNTPQLPGFFYPLLFLIGVGAHNYYFSGLATMLAGVGSLALLINIIDKSPPWFQKVMSAGILRQLGLRSFSIYLWQQPFFVFKQQGIISPGVALVMALVAGFVSYATVERPVRAYLNKRWAAP